MTPVLLALAAVLVVANVPLSDVGVREFGLDWARDWRGVNAAFFDKSDFGILRYVHFLALAYLVWVLAGDKGSNLMALGAGRLAQVWTICLAVILKVGQQIDQQCRAPITAKDVHHKAKEPCREHADHKDRKALLADL